MRYFGLFDFQQAVLAISLGFLALILAIVAWGGYTRREGAPAPALEGDAGPQADSNPVPPVLVFVYAAVAAGALGYAAVIWLSGAPVGY